jgi:predicted phosphodiesterase
MKKALPAFSLLLATAFTTIALALRPLWYDIHEFLGTTLPAMPVLLGLGGLFFLYSLSLLYGSGLSGRRARLHLGLLAGGALAMAALLVVLFTQIGIETALLWEMLRQALPAAAWLSAAALLFWAAPVWPALRPWRRRLGVLAGLGLAALLWWSLPWQTAILSDPLVFIMRGGVSAVWQTNLRASAQVIYGTDGALGGNQTSQAFGLKVLNSRIQSALVPLLPAGQSLRVQAISEGVKEVFPISAVKTGKALSQVVEVPFPPRGAEITFVSFSDIHEQTGVYARLAAHIDWQTVDLAVYNGDMVNSVLSAEQFSRTLFNLPTGGRVLPRLYLRGNHETHGEGARLLDEWLLPPPGGRWYHAFTLGNTFFIVLDSGECYEDGHIEYSGLVDFHTYHREQARWLEELPQSPEFAAARYRVVLVHAPLHRAISPDFDRIGQWLIHRNDIDLMVSGHTHKYGIWPPAETGLPFTIATSGGSSLADAAFVQVRSTGQGLEVKVVDANGKVRSSTVLGQGK